MFGHSIAEFFGQMLIGFTRSVAEQYNFDERESHGNCFATTATTL